MCSVILLAGIRSPVIGEIKNCSLAVGAVAAGLGAEVQDNKYTYVHTQIHYMYHNTVAYNIHIIQ